MKSTVIEYKSEKIHITNGYYWALTKPHKSLAAAKKYIDSFHEEYGDWIKEQDSKQIEEMEQKQMTKKKIIKPKTVSEMKNKHPKLYEEFLRQKMKYGVTFQNFVSNL